MSVETTRAVDQTADTETEEPASSGTTTSRRAFLGGAGTAVAVGGLLAVVPKFANGQSDADAQRAVADAAQRLDVSPDDPLIVHVSDLANGEINLYAGEQHIVIHDRDLATRLAAAASNG
jgi:hypothetical protein